MCRNGCSILTRALQTFASNFSLTAALGRRCCHPTLQLRPLRRCRTHSLSYWRSWHQARQGDRAGSRFKGCWLGEPPRLRFAGPGAPQGKVPVLPLYPPLPARKPCSVDGRSWWTPTTCLIPAAFESPSHDSRKATQWIRGYHNGFTGKKTERWNDSPKVTLKWPAQGGSWSHISLLLPVINETDFHIWVNFLEKTGWRWDTYEDFFFSFPNQSVMVCN